MSGGEGLIWLCRALSWSHDALALIALIALLIVLHLGAWFIMEIYGLMLGFWYLLIRSEAQVKIICFANVIFVLEHNNINLNDTLTHLNPYFSIVNGHQYGG